MTNKLGWYDEKQREYVVNLTGEEWTPLPWSNVIANKDFGTLVTCSGASFTWFLNSSLFRLTPWVNDPLIEGSGEQIFLSDDTTSQVWSPTPLPFREEFPYKIAIGLGYTVFEHSSHQILQKVKYFVHKDKPLKYVTVSLTNLAKVPRKISVSYCCKWVLGTFPDLTKRFLWTGLSNRKDALIAKVLSNDFRTAYTAFLTCDRNTNTQYLNDKTTVSKTFNLTPGQEVSVTFILGVAKNEFLEKEIQSAKKSHPEKAFNDGQDFWQNVTKTIQVDCPDKDLNILFNDRLVYQALACRLWARTGLYQPSGAFGFRDQLQDSLALVWSQPNLTREQIVLAASRQLLTGEVQQWWHPPENHGAVSTSSDTPLWLVYAVCKYWKITGDSSIFSEKVPYLDDKEKKEATLYHHCLLSIDRSLSLMGPHGLPLMLSGDWNDSLNNVGTQRQGESVWLSLFLSYILDNFSKVCEIHQEEDKAISFRQIARYQAELVEKNAWFGDQFARAFTDSGAVVGTPESPFVHIDSIVQSWAVICGLVKKDFAQTAIKSLLERLVDKKNGLVKLLTPPVTTSPEGYLGYITQYPPGTRENGGFYCHAATWVVWALALLGDGDSAAQIIEMLNPLKRTSTPKGMEQYMAEPYAMASDIYSQEPYLGRAGWTWYTGSAATLYFVLTEEIFGIKQRKDTLVIDPCLPKSWGRVAITFHCRQETYQIEILNPNRVSKGVKEIVCDGVKVDVNGIILGNTSSTHQVIVTMG